jgi:hypothetical protein
MWAKLEDVVKMQRREVLGVLSAAVGSALLPGSLATAEHTPAANHLPKERVTVELWQPLSAVTVK